VANYYVTQFAASSDDGKSADAKSADASLWIPPRKDRFGPELKALLCFSSITPFLAIAVSHPIRDGIFDEARRLSPVLGLGLSEHTMQQSAPQAN
jgi:hypothetical protein